jgi:hypothetical protein
MRTYPHYRFPPSSALKQRLPKEAFYQRLQANSRLKQAFVTQIQEIIWRYKLAAETINLAVDGDYSELHVFDIQLKPGVLELDEDVLRAIDSLIVFPLFYRIMRNHAEQPQWQYQLAYKLPPAAPGKGKVGRYFASPWLPAPDEADFCPLPIALNITQLYRQLLQPLVAQPPRAEEPLMVWMARLDQISQQQQRIHRLQNQLQREKQFNRKLELHRELGELKRSLQAITD